MTATEVGRVLVVDDEHLNRILLYDLLSAHGFQVDCAEEGNEGIAMAREADPDVILLDVMMPGRDGFEICAELKADSATRHIPVIMLTALTDKASMVRGIEAGADEFVSKPVDTRAMPARVRNAVRSKKLYAELQENYRQLSELEASREGLTNMIVHDMRTPLLGISGSLELFMLTSADKIGPDETGHVSTAISQCGRLVDMVNSLLDIGRLQNQRMPLHPRDADLREIIVDAVEIVGAYAHDVPIELVVSGNRTPSTVCDPGVIQRVITNLVGNSLKFVDQQTGKVDIELTELRDTYRFAVRDNGPGIAESTQANIFDLFKVGDAEGITASSGVGLAFCKLAVEAHGGTIGVECPPEGGSIFWFELPAQASRATAKDSEILTN